MRAIITVATGMVGGSVLMECLRKGESIRISDVGKAIINASNGGYTKHVLEISDIRQLAVSR